MRVVSLASGSSGNALLIEAGPRGRTRLLIDAGIGVRLLTRRLQAVGVHPAQLRGIVLTHEHSDHVMGLPALLKYYAVPIIADPRTLNAVEDGLRTGAWRSDYGRLISARNEDEIAVKRESHTSPLFDSLGTHSVAEGDALSGVQGTMSVLQIAPSAVEAVDAPAAMPITPAMLPLPVGSRRTIGDIHIISFPISHDAVAPCGYLLQAGGCRVCIVTDSGEVTPVMLAHMRQADLLILEANHDRERLLRGPYPWSLKQRILSSTGHLSNTQSAEAVLQTWPSDGVRWLWLAHLSRTNNTPTLALASIRASLQAAGASLDHIHISALPPGMGYTWDTARLWHTPSLWTMES